MSDLFEVICPYCAQPFEVDVDISAGREQSYISDCEICCRPIQFTVTVADDGEVTIDAQSESEA